MKFEILNNVGNKRTSVDQDISMQDIRGSEFQVLNLMLWCSDVLPTDILVS
jgi:hypothetical protein